MNLFEEFSELRKLYVQGNNGALKAFAAEAARDSLELSDRRLAQFSIIAYSLEKLTDKSYIVQSKRWKKFTVFLLGELQRGAQCLDEKQCELVLSAVMHELDNLSSDLGRFVVNAVEKAKVKAATQVYAHGASIGRAIELTGADRKELLSYIGSTRLPEKYESKSVAQRLAFAEKLFA